MRKRTQVSSSSAYKPSNSEATDTSKADEDVKTSNVNVISAKRSGFVWIIMFVAAMYASWCVFYYQFEYMPPPLSAAQAGKRGFSELEAIKHVKALTELGPHPVGSDALDRAQQVVFIGFSFLILLFVLVYNL